MRFHRTLAAVAATLLAGPLLVTGTAQAAPAIKGPAWSPALLTTEPLYDGSAVRLRYTEGITVVASADAKVIFTGSGALTTTADGRRVYDRAVEIVDPHALDRSSDADAAAYAAAGRSVYTDALAAGFGPAEARREAQPQDIALLDEPPIAASGCIYSETSYPDPEFEWSGCYKLYNVTDADSSAWYGAGSGTAHGWGTGVLGGGKELQKGNSQITWSGAGAQIIEASPSANQSGNNCGNVTIGLSQIIELSYQVPLCNDGWNVTWNQTVHNVQWHGASAGGSNDSRSASGASTVRLPWTTPTVYISYRIGWTYACFC
jgi:hypothetical protein